MSTLKFTSAPNQEVYYAEVWHLVRQIPRGRVCTYGQIAAWLSPPAGVTPQAYRAFGPRWVGGAMRHCPDDVPWQRVVNARGEISLKGQGFQTQHDLLTQEGVEFNERGRIDLDRFAWEGPNTHREH